KALQLIRYSAFQCDHVPALMQLGTMSLFNSHGFRRNLPTAMAAFERAAAHGDSTAQRYVGLLSATGLGTPGAQRDYARAIVYLSFAAVGGDTASQQALGYYHLTGIGVEKECNEASWHYARVAERAVDAFLDGPPTGRHLPSERVKLTTWSGGPYGWDASGPGNPRLSAYGNGKDILQFYRMQAEEGNALYEFQLGLALYWGMHNVTRNYLGAAKYFKRAAQRWDPNLSAEQSALSRSQIASAHATGYLGWMYWRGEGVAENVSTARSWFELGLERRDSRSMNGIAHMLDRGLGGLPADSERAFSLWSEAASRENTDAQAQLGVKLWQRGQFQQAAAWFAKAAQHDHPLALLYLGNMHRAGQGLPENCQMSIAFHKRVAELVDWAIDQPMHAAQEALRRGDLGTALVHYLFAGELGYESAQLNAAWILDQQWPIRSAEWRALAHVWDQTALALWNRAANQGNTDGRVKTGDYYYYGRGTGLRPPHGTLRGDTPDYERAAVYYRVAAETEHSSIGMWNLGYMYEHGLGVPTDYHLAHRMYGMALLTNPEAYLPIYMSLVA
ncbi:hypothetical protein CXG81DRAFT_2120, partial [Caulochytrium protostelioides]